MRFLEGRPADLKRTIGEGVVEVLQKHFAPAEEEMELQVTAEIQDIRRAEYFKYPPGTLGPPPLSVV
jgi:5-carboxymethyl-2-hydroxymuconate isomerase